MRSLNSAIDPLDRILAIDPTNEAAVQRLIKLLAQLDRRGEALRVYKRLAAILQQEYHIAPLPETRALYDAVRLGVQERKHDTAVPANKDSGAVTGKDEYKDAVPALQIGRSHQSPLVGRDHLLRTLLDSARAAASGSTPTIVTLLGAAGYGKTHLAQILVQHLEIVPAFQMLFVRAKEVLGGVEEQTTRELLRSTLALPDAAPADLGRALLAERLGAEIAKEVWAGVAITMGWAPPEHPELRANYDAWTRTP